MPTVCLAHSRRFKCPPTLGGRDSHHVRFTDQPRKGLCLRKTESEPRSGKRGELLAHGGTAAGRSEGEACPEKWPERALSGGWRVSRRSPNQALRGAVVPTKRAAVAPPAWPRREPQESGLELGALPASPSPPPHSDTLDPSAQGDALEEDEGCLAPARDRPALTGDGGGVLRVQNAQGHAAERAPFTSGLLFGLRIGKGGRLNPGHG